MRGLMERGSLCMSGVGHGDDDDDDDEKGGLCV